jgi:hypothetical protein
MKTKKETELLVELEYEQSLLDNLTYALSIQQRAVKHVLGKLEDYYNENLRGTSNEN